MPYRLEILEIDEVPRAMLLQIVNGELERAAIFTIEPPKPVPPPVYGFLEGLWPKSWKK